MTFSARTNNGDGRQCTVVHTANIAGSLPGYNSAVKAHLKQPDTTSATARLKASTRDISAFGESLSRSVSGISRRLQASTLQETERHSTQKEFNRVSRNARQSLVDKCRG